MRNEAYKLTGFTAVAGAIGFFLRWLQTMRIIDKDTGLAASAGVSWVFSLYLLAVAGVLIFFVYGKAGRCSIPEKPERALAGQTPLFTAVGVLCAVLLLGSGFGQFISAGDETRSTVHRLCGLACMLGALGTLMLTYGASDAARAGLRRVGSVMMVVFGCFWLVSAYKDAAYDPVIWKNVVDVLAVCADLIAFYYIAGFHLEEPKPRNTLLFCELGAFLTLVSLIDEHTVSERVTYGAVSLLLFAWGFVMTENMEH